MHLVRSGRSHARQPQPAPGRYPGSMPARPFARPFALRSLTVTPAGRARRLAKPTGVPPRPPLGPPLPVLCALRPSQSPSPAARYFHTSQCPGPGA